MDKQKLFCGHGGITMKENVRFWNINNMLYYAQKVYNIPDEILFEDTDFAISTRKTYEKQIRRTLQEYKIVQKVDNQYNYVLPDIIARFFIDTVLEPYFNGDAQISTETIKEDFLKKDYELNEEQSIKHAEYISELSREQYGSKEENNDEIITTPDKSYFEYHIKEWESDDDIVQQMMIRAIFDFLYDFDEVSYRKDLYELKRRIEPGAPEPFLQGYSELKNKLDNPSKFYYTRKKQGHEK